MARHICALSLELEQRMNTFVRIGTIEEHIIYGGAIDAADDERRKDSFGLDKHNEDMMIYFSRLLKKAIKKKDWELVEQVDSEMDDFSRKYFAKRKELQEKELYYEDLDDKLRVWLLEYISKCLEKTRDESYKIDLQMIKENLEKKREKKLKNQRGKSV